MVMAEGGENNDSNNNAGERVTEESRPLPITTASGTDVNSISNTSNTPQIQNFSSPSLADDTSVLPVPSHVVLHHLCTSAMRNGVLAVGETTRYRKKVRGVFFSFGCF
ncbi:hypothetical protein J3R30DRAFT_3459217 [Lentinula aciculospora]|uniref:Association with the SNF1 complex (ASC) domain-containing protein n=1 Tax=Lentinula aciculospora TaxID=153920 RepID=A0A9W9DR60_9AGAR|nr:hypothetical protein J3R30DRAFT_3459217 [Lentinula aciculospora]